MNHRQIDQLDLIDRYLMGKLLAEESASFEAHFVDCPQCIARLQTTKAFLEDLRGMAAAQAWQAEPRQTASASRTLLQTLLRRPLALAIGALLMVAITTAIFVIGHTRRLRAEAAEAKRLAAHWEQRYEDERQSAIAAEARHQQSESRQAEQQRALEARLKDEAAQREMLAAEFSRQLPVAGHLPIIVLTSLRDGQSAAGVVTVNRSAPVFALIISLEGQGQYQTYRGAILDSHDRRIWSGRLSRDPSDSLSAYFKSSRFQSGSYSLVVEAITQAGGREEIGNYPFVINKIP